MTVHQIKRNDTRPYFAVSLTYSDGSAVSLTSATAIRFIARDRSDGTVKIAANATITNATSGDVEYQFTSTDTDTAGSFDVEWEVTWNDGTVQTFPTVGYDLLIVQGDLA